ncbi:MAG: ATP-binding protein, partial [Anaerolineae bacterium]|nr:ATP-binding protein [Anaerolineae bacterium]
MIKDPRLFVGRKEEIRMILSRMEGAQPISVNIVGERRIGKSSLLYHIFQTYDQRVSQPNRYVVVYLSLQSVALWTVDEFHRTVARAFLERPTVQRDPELAEALNRQPMTSDAFREAFRQFQRKGLRPVLCLDEFEEFLKYPQEFNDSFYEHLRALTNESAWMLVIASRRPIGGYRREHRLTSGFFNDAHTEWLGEFEEEEAADLVRLPASTVPGAPEALSPEDQRLALRWSRRHPCLLQGKDTD